MILFSRFLCEFELYRERLDKQQKVAEASRKEAQEKVSERFCVTGAFSFY